MGNLSRDVALCVILVFLISTGIGSTLPEFGDILAIRLGIRAHFFNKFFFALGIIGVGLALYLGYRCGGR